MEQDIYLTCPQCGGTIQVEKLNCGIFRHGFFKKTKKQIPPHATLKQCQEYVKKGLIWGCGKPFQVIKKDNTFIILHCGYI